MFEQTTLDVDLRQLESVTVVAEATPAVSCMARVVGFLEVQVSVFVGVVCSGLVAQQSVSRIL